MNTQKDAIHAIKLFTRKKLPIYSEILHFFWNVIHAIPYY